MRRTSLFFSTLFLATGICRAQQQAGDTSVNQQNVGARQTAEPAGASLRDPALDNAPDAVKEQFLRNAAAQNLKELAVHQWNGANIYEAVFEGQNVETRLRLDESGAPLSMHIAGLGGPIVDEAAGARRDDRPEAAQPQAQQAAPIQQPSVPNEIRERIQQQLGDETPLLEVQPKVFYQLNIRQNGNVQQIWADETGTVLREEQSR
jgi:hypothetical protein